MLDIFRSDAFGIVPLTLAINNLVFVPGYISGRGLYSESSIAQTFFAIEEKNNMLVLVAPTPRGGPGHTLAKGPRAIRMLAVPHFEINDAIMAEEVQGVRPFGEESGADAVMTKVGERIQLAGQSLEYTQEYSRVGGIKGVITYADGTTIDLFNEYGIPVPPNTDMNLDYTGAPDGSLRLKATGIVRTVGANLNGQPFTGVEALCGDAFFDALIKHPEVRQTYLGYVAAAELRQPYITAGQTWASFEFGGINWINYRGYVGTTPMIETNMAYIYPLGVPNLFLTVFAPADYIETVNTMGKPRYVKQYTMQNDKGVHMDTQMNALNWCTRPTTLQRAILT
jgi:hypothetical protein